MKKSCASKRKVIDLTGDVERSPAKRVTRRVASGATPPPTKEVVNLVTAEEVHEAGVAQASLERADTLTIPDDAILCACEASPSKPNGLSGGKSRSRVGEALSRVLSGESVRKADELAERLESHAKAGSHMERVFSLGASSLRENALKLTESRTSARWPDSDGRGEGSAVVEEELVDVRVLPVEIWVQVYEHLDDCARLDLSRTCMWLHAIFRECVGLRSIQICAAEMKSVKGLCDPAYRVIEEEITTSSYAVDYFRFGRHCFSTEDAEAFFGGKRPPGGRYFRSVLKDFMLVLYHPTQESRTSQAQLEAEMSHYFCSQKEARGSRLKILADPKRSVVAVCALHMFPPCFGNFFSLEENITKKYTDLFSVRAFVIRDAVKLSVRVDTEVLRRMAMDIIPLASGQRIPLAYHELLFQTAAVESKKYMTSGSYWNRSSVSECASASTPPKQPRNVVIDLKTYQLRALGWMLGKERSMDRNWYEFNCHIALPGCGELGLQKHFHKMDHSWQSDVSSSVDKEENAQLFRFRARGGVYADEMGLGKTATVISLIASHPRPRVERSASSVSLDNSSSTDGQNDEASNASDFGDPVLRKRQAHESGATLILVPNQLVVQWKGEFKKFAPSLTVLQLRSMRDIAKCTYKDYEEADAVVMSHQLYCNKKLATADVSLFTVGWHRLVVDEAHEMKHLPVVMHIYAEDTTRLHSTYRWYVSGTPFPHGGTSLRNAIDFLVDDGGELQDRKSYKDFKNAVNIEALRPNVYGVLKKFLYWRNIKETVALQTSIPKLVEEVAYVALSPIERDMYDAAEVAGDHADMRKVCTDPHASAMCSLVVLPRSGDDEPLLRDADVRQEKLKQLEGLLKDHEANVLTRKTTLEGYRQQLARAREQKSTVASVRAKKELTRTIGTMLTKVNGAEIALEAAEDSVVKAIGQISCFSRDPSHRPVPNQRLSIAHDLPLQAVEKYGSKLAALGAFITGVLTEQPDAKIIVFTGHDSMVSRMTKALLEDGRFQKHQIVSCKGNYAVRGKAIERFNATGKKAAYVMVLSLKNSASGTHLACASHVVLLDPIAGTREEVQAQDGQAIARAHRIGQDRVVTVVRLIVADSIDERDYESAYGSGGA